MQPFSPQTIVANSARNQFTTLSQPFSVTNSVGTPGPDDYGVSVWETEPERNEQGLFLDVPLYYIDSQGNETQKTLQNYPVIDDPNEPFAKKLPICHWVTVPYQTVGGSQNLDNPTHLDVGVIAFHGSGQIDRVEFFLNGPSNRVVVREVSHHPDQDVTAYWIRIDQTSGLVDSGDIFGTSITDNDKKISGCTFSPHHELQAVVYPRVGKPRVLAGKHNNHAGLLSYNGHAQYWKDSTVQRERVEYNDSNIRSYYFSSNFNNTLFQGSVYVSADNGVDDLNRSGTKQEPMKSIDFAYRKLMRLKYKFYNNLQAEPVINTEGDVGGGTIFLMQHTTPLSQFNGHKNGYKNPIDDSVPYTTFSRMRWVTITPEPGVDKILAKIKGWQPQPFEFATDANSSTNRDGEISGLSIKLKAVTRDIRTTLPRYKNCLIEADWPYNEYLFGIGPDLDRVGDDGTATKLIELKDWKVKKGAATRNLTKEKTETLQEVRVVGTNDTAFTNYQYTNANAKTTAGPYVPPRYWVDSSTIDGSKRSSNKIYEWADIMGMTYSTTFVGAPDIEGEQNRRNIVFDNSSYKKGVFSATNDVKQQFGIALGITNANAEGLSLTTPRIYVEPTEQTLAITNGLGFTLGVGYTFDFAWPHPEFADCKSQINTGFIVPVFCTNSVIKTVNQPAEFPFASFVNSTLVNYAADVFRYPSALVYQPFLVDGVVSRNYVNTNGSPLYGVHSDVFQTIQGQLNIQRQHTGVENFIFYRFNNPSPRSKRYYDPVARHGVPGIGPLTNITFKSQWNISGRADGTIPRMFYGPPHYPEGDGRTYGIWTTRHVKDVVFQDCLIYTEDASQQLDFTCLHENLIVRNTQVHAGIDRAIPVPNTNWVNTPKTGGTVVRYKDAVPASTTLNTANDNTTTESEVTAFDHALFDNYQCYQTVSRKKPGTNEDYRINTYEDDLYFYLRKGTATAVRVPIDGPFRPKPKGHSLYGEPEFIPSPSVFTSDLSYPFERDAQGNAGPNQPVGSTAKIFFLVPTDRYRNAVINYQNKGNPHPQPTSSTRGEWFTYHKTIPASTTGNDAPYGWIYSNVPYENFRYGRLPYPNGSAAQGGNVDLFDADPFFFIKQNKPDGNGGFTYGTTKFDSRCALGTGWDPTLGTGKLNPQPTDPGYNPNQRGFRETVIISFTNFDYDGTRSQFGEVYTREQLIALGEIEGDSVGWVERTIPPPISNHPITISLTTTDIAKDISWNNKNSFSGITHGSDSFYSASSLVQIPNYLERIEDITDPNDHPSIGPSRSNEISGNTFIIGNQGGVYVTGGTKDATLNSQIGTMNSIDVKNLASKFQSVVRTAGGNTFAVILHGKTIPSTEYGEYKYLAAPFMTQEEWLESGGIDPNIDVGGIAYEDFYKKFAYISFHSKEASVTQSITSNQFSFRKSAHHTYINFSRPEMDGLSLSSTLNGTSIIDMVTPFVNVSKLAKLQTAAIGSTCAFNSYPGESTSAERVPLIGGSPSTITCAAKNLEYLGFDGNQIRVRNKAASSLFSSGSPKYEHNGAIGSNIQDFQFSSSVNDYRFPPPPPELPGDPIVPEASINLRFINPVGSGSKNLLGYKIPLNGTRLFGGSSNIGITAGSYIRISGSPNNNGIYQVLSTIDGIDGDLLSNTASNGLPEYQYLELSRSITAQEQAVGNNITIENISHLPILHIKYRTPV